MQSRAQLFGHPIHQMLVVFPLGLLITGVIFDIVYFLTDEARFATVGYWNITAGIIGGLIAAVFGFIDWLAIPKGTRAKRIGRMHGIGNAVLLALFITSWALRRPDDLHLPVATAFTLQIIGIGLGAVTAWLGGELVDRLGVGVHEGANLDAPSSLSRRPATSR